MLNNMFLLCFTRISFVGPSDKVNDSVVNSDSNPVPYPYPDTLIYQPKSLIESYSYSIIIMNS